MTTPLPLDHLKLLVSSWEASRPYYETLLPLIGFAPASETVWHDGKGLHLAFGEAEPGTRPYERFGAGMNHLGFAAPDRETVERIRAAMAAAGFEVPALQSLGGATALFMKDRDGIRLEITYYPPGMPPVA